MTTVSIWQVKWDDRVAGWSWVGVVVGGGGWWLVVVLQVEKIAFIP